jgi:hypothetical protein
MRTAMTMLALLAPLLTFAGCATDPAKLAESDDAKCTAAGFKPGSEGFFSCQNQLQTRRAERSNRQREEFITGKPDLPR